MSDDGAVVINNSPTAYPSKPLVLEEVNAESIKFEIHKDVSVTIGRDPAQQGRCPASTDSKNRSELSQDRGGGDCFQGKNVRS